MESQGRPGRLFNQTPSRYLVGLKEVQNIKNNPRGKVINQEKLLSICHKQKTDIETKDLKITRLEKDCERYRKEIKRLKEQNEKLSKDVEFQMSNTKSVEDVFG